MVNYEAYETVVGLEVHAQLFTESKLFCGDATAYGAEPNTQVSPITLGHPGTLPKMNRKAIEYAVKMGLACQSEIARQFYFARKNYFYPDLPKGYQVTQQSTPVCSGGFITINTEAGERRVRLHHIHLEEDAGKSLHDIDAGYTCIDYNRAGTPLIEIVSEPDLRSGDEAYAFLAAIRRLVRYLGICDGNMEEGSLRCDANISVRKKGDTRLGTRTEIKNLNSIRNVKKAIDAESMRLVGILEQGGTIIQQTRSFDAGSGTSFPLRDKEDADDYRYFPEPDLAPFSLQEEFIDKIRVAIPVLAEQRIKKYVSEMKLSEYDAGLLSEERKVADYFESLVFAGAVPKPAANWVLGPVKTWLNEQAKDIGEFPLPPEKLATLIRLVEEGKLSFSAASAKIFPQWISDPSLSPEAIARTGNLFQESDHLALALLIDEVLIKFAGKVTEYKKGKKGLLALFVGEVMKRSNGRADPKITNELLLEKLKS